jgi:hypothetical protein
MPWYRMPDGSPFHAKIGKRKAREPAPCRAARPDGTRCGCISGYLCDHPVNDQGETCDMPLCEAHAHVVGDDRHCCPKHYNPQDAA